jgi:hypothetical protein
MKTGKLREIRDELMKGKEIGEEIGSFTHRVIGSLKSCQLSVVSFPLHKARWNRNP